MPAKSIFQSRTAWVNGITTAIAVVGAVQGQQWISDNPTVVAGLIAAIGVLNVALRFVTTVPVALK